MASVDDVFNAINAADSKLDLVHSDLQTANQSLSVIAGALKDGFQLVEDRLDALVSGQQATNRALLHLIQQTDAELCVLEHISKNTCILVNEADAQRRLQEQLVAAVEAMTFVIKTAHPAAELERQRFVEAEERSRRCCPEEPRTPPCIYAPCPKPTPIQAEEPPPR